jgi:type I restriction enzyme R subunit
VDFCCYEHRLIVELDGDVHAETAQIEKDQRRDARLRELGFRILRVPNGMVLRCPNFFAEEIRKAVGPSPGASRRPLPEGPEGEGGGR